ncbi:pectin lyase fold/virulence factor [Blyttiomyces helicus]|uniref:Pectin lyase fold/virulence factor n=1 Tax=Blyttiomyces helicus TaxID=388810 RepID=A0A4V1IPH0_9FUNG|nr:pectin lyase fold/virulence factor [Blyttiomyces helicus]|eukprot:RKO83027.1 pectin lyase fold/virulence factor [Blyttiomyces helicus]
MVINVKTGSLTGITLTQVRAAHFKIGQSSQFEVSGITASSASNSAKLAKNTDGIDVSESTGIHIHDVTIVSGDDAIALEGGAVDIDIRRIHAGGLCHGVSVGSLGPPAKLNANVADTSVRNVWVQDVNFDGCTHAIHIKSWATAVQGVASNITYSNIVLNNVGAAITLEQNYFDGPCADCKPNQSHIQFEDITIDGVSGTATKPNYFGFSQAAPAQNIVLENISGIVTPAGQPVAVECGFTAGSQFGPDITCPVVRKNNP